MKKTLLFLLTFIYLLLLNNINPNAEDVLEKKIVYFKSSSCGECGLTTPYIESLEESGITVIIINIVNKKDDNMTLLKNYCYTYNVPTDLQTVPIVFSGDTYYSSRPVILEAIENNEIQDNASMPMLEIKDAPMSHIGLIGVIFSGLLDGFNPCAIAMLLLFISLLGFTSNRKTLIGVSLTYISALFITYFALGTVLFKTIQYININAIAIFINVFIIGLCLILFIYNMYDFFVSKNEKYEKIKLQLPKGIQKFNKKIIKFYTSKLNEKSKWIYIITFFLGFIISLTEFLCTGQIYLPIIISLVQFSDSLNLSAILYLIIYNLAFVTPLIVIAVIAIKTQSVFSTSDFIRRKLHLIKLFNGLFFLVIALIYILKFI